jgi:GntR family transcriptional regulator, transcriptional repressor for pyruvate dehydrogenase complex
MQLTCPLPQKAILMNTEKDKLSNQIVNDLLQRIINQDYSPGTFLPSERELQSKYGVSRPVIREALHTLTALGVISSAPRKGAVVNPDTAQPLVDAMLLAFSRSDVYVNDILAVRLLIETHVASLAAEKATDEQIRNLQYICMQAEAIDTEHGWPAWRELDKQFHIELARATQNPVLVMLVEVLKSVLWDQAALPRELIGAKELEVAIRQHRKITDMIATRVASAAQGAMRDHLMSSLVNQVEHKRIELALDNNAHNDTQDA